jgi:hypothetical protein
MGTQPRFAVDDLITKTEALSPWAHIVVIGVRSNCPYRHKIRSQFDHVDRFSRSPALNISPSAAGKGITYQLQPSFRPSRCIRVWSPTTSLYDYIGNLNET